MSPSPGQDRRRIADLAVLAPVLVFMLLVPPLIGLFAVETSVFGAPMIVVYLFGVWLLAIVIAAFISRKARALEPPDQTPPR